MSRSVAVIGGGAIGLTASVALARRGAEVTVFERDELGSGATGRAAGICYDAYGQRVDAKIAAQSLERFREMGVLTDCPYVWYAREDDDVAAAIKSHVDQMQAVGRNVSLVEPDLITAQFPAFRTEDITTMAVSRNAGYVDSSAYIEQMAATARGEGVDIRTGTEATVIESEEPSVSDGVEFQLGTESGVYEFDAVLVAAGAATSSVLAETSVDLAVGTYRTQALVAELTPPVPMFYDASEEWYGRPTAEGVLAGDGSHAYDGVPADYDSTADVSFCRDRVSALNKRIEGTGEIERSWAGLCTATPDRDPLLGGCSPGLFVATGLCGHGFMRSPALGEAIADKILGLEPDCDISGFEPSRFVGTEEIDLPLGITE